MLGGVPAVQASPEKAAMALMARMGKGSITCLLTRLMDAFARSIPWSSARLSSDFDMPVTEAVHMKEAMVLWSHDLSDFHMLLA